MYDVRACFVILCLTSVGTIPDAIGGLKRLTSLKLDHNSLSGRLPSSLTRLTSLTALDLAWNKLTGTIPMKLGTMTSLHRLSLGMNKVLCDCCVVQQAIAYPCFILSFV